MIASSSRGNTQSISKSKLFWGLCLPSLVVMKNIYEVLRSKEMDLVRFKSMRSGWLRPCLPTGLLNRATSTVCASLTSHGRPRYRRTSGP